MDKPYLHHLLIAARDAERSRRFYVDVLELEEIARPAFPFAGAWFQIGATQQLHIVVRSESMSRGDKNIDSWDVHFALRVKSYRETLAWLEAKGFRGDLPEDDLRKIILKPESIAGNPQIYVLDPDRNIIEFNCESLD
jgi:glyoxylase I family protein